MKKYAALFTLLCALVVLLPTQAQDDDQRITPDNADQVTSLGIVLQSPQGAFRGAIVSDWSYAVLGQSSDQGDFQVWDMQTGIQRYAAATQHKIVSSFAISPDAQLIAIGSADGTIQLWDAAEGVVLHTLMEGHVDGGFTSVAFSPDGTLLASAGAFDAVIQIWDVATGELVATMTDSADVWLVHFSPDGTQLAGGSQHSGTRVWDVATGDIVFAVPPTNGAMYWSAWTPDSTQLVTGCPSPHGTMCLWEVPSGDLVWQTTEDMFADVRALAFNADGSLLASGAGNTTGIILDGATGIVLKSLDVYYNNWTVALSWSSDGTQLASIGQDGSLRLWGLLLGTVPSSLVTLTFTPTGTTTFMPPTYTPAPPTRTPTATPLPLLEVGGRAQVHVINNEALNVRSEPMIANNLLQVLFDGDVVTLLEGPHETGGLVWWRVRTAQGTEGWVVESADGIQTLIPLAD
jgi:WD40 repeat protein